MFLAGDVIARRRTSTNRKFTAQLGWQLARRNGDVFATQNCTR